MTVVGVVHSHHHIVVVPLGGAKCAQASHYLAVEIAHIAAVAAHIVAHFGLVGRQCGPQIALISAVGRQYGVFAVNAEHQLSVYYRHGCLLGSRGASVAYRGLYLASVGDGNGGVAIDANGVEVAHALGERFALAGGKILHFHIGAAKSVFKSVLAISHCIAAIGDGGVVARAEGFGQHLHFLRCEVVFGEAVELRPGEQYVIALGADACHHCGVGAHYVETLHRCHFEHLRHRCGCRSQCQCKKYFSHSLLICFLVL